MDPTIVLPLESPLLGQDGLRPAVALWCQERLTGGLRLLYTPSECLLVFTELSDSLAFARRWM